MQIYLLKMEVGSLTFEVFNGWIEGFYGMVFCNYFLIFEKLGNNWIMYHNSLAGSQNTLSKF